MRRAVALLLLLAATAAWAANSTDVPAAFRGVGFDQQLGERLPLETSFRDADDRPVQLGDYFHGRPVLLLFTYFGCTNLCPVVLDGTLQVLNTIPYTAGEDFEVVVVSIEPKDVPALARETRAGYLRRYRRGDSGWHFLTGPAPSVAAVTGAAGFRYRWVEEKRQYAHAAGVVVATGEGRLARYLFGVRYDPSDLRLALVEAAQGRVGNPVDRLLLLCYGYDPQTGRYAPLVMNVLRAAGTATVLVLAGALWFMSRRYRRRG